MSSQICCFRKLSFEYMTDGSAPLDIKPHSTKTTENLNALQEPQNTSSIFSGTPIATKPALDVAVQLLTARVERLELAHMQHAPSETDPPRETQRACDEFARNLC